MRNRLLDLTIIGTGAALSIVLGLVCKAFPLPRLPYGGSITLESIPILYVALWRGWRQGLQTGVLCGLLQLLLDAHIYHPAQVLLDYPIAFGLLGFAPIVGYAIPGIFLGCALRFCAHFASGIIFFAAYAPEGTPAWLYSATYNASYLIPDAILASVLVPMLLKRTGKEKPTVATETAGS